MKIIFFVALLCYKQRIMIIWFFTFFLQNEIDFVRRSDFIFILRLVWDSTLKCFSLWFFLRSLSFSFNCFFFIDCRFDHREIIISHCLFLTVSMQILETKTHVYFINCTWLVCRSYLNNVWKSTNTTR